jgi:endonuclease YncB( thermonuclease family)
MSKYLLIFSIMFSSVAFAADVELKNVRVVDGDTIEATVVTRHKPRPERTIIDEEVRMIRFTDLNTAERHTQAGKDATSDLKGFIESRLLRLKTEWQTGKFGRLLGTLWRYDRPTGKWQSVAVLMREAGHDGQGR